MNAGTNPHICSLLIFQKVVKDSLLNKCDEVMAYLYGFQRSKIIYSTFSEHNKIMQKLSRL